MTQKKCYLIAAGGTIDSKPYGDVHPEYITPLEVSMVHHVAHSLDVAGECKFFRFSDKDSKEFHPAELNKLAGIIKARPESHIIVTFGTDWLPEIARYMQKQLRSTKKTITLTGALLPLSNGLHSDGYKNLEVALSRNALDDPGVKVVMHGEVFEPQYLYKDFLAKKFRIGEPGDAHIKTLEQRLAENKNKVLIQRTKASDGRY